MIDFGKAALLVLVLILFGCKKIQKNQDTLDFEEEVTTAKNFNVMSTDFPPLISGIELFNIKNKEDLLLIDARFGKSAKADYLKAHLKGALYVDLNKQLSDIKEDAANGGRHPLPSITEFSKVLASLGITKESHVIVYDTTNGAMAAARFWWMLKAVGHKKLQVLNGGMKEAVKVGFPTNSGEESTDEVSSYEIKKWSLPLTSIDEVEKNVQDENHIVIDVRAEERYKGETEPIDLIAGHIPGAINVPLTGNVNADGLFLSSEELNIKYKNIIGDIPSKNVTVHCGSGVTACHTLLALNHAGFKIPNLYVGSWSEWSRNNKPIATND